MSCPLWKLNQGPLQKQHRAISPAPSSPFMTKFSQVFSVGVSFVLSSVFLCFELFPSILWLNILEDITTALCTNLPGSVPFKKCLHILGTPLLSGIIKIAQAHQGKHSSSLRSPDSF